MPSYIMINGHGGTGSNDGERALGWAGRGSVPAGRSECPVFRF